MITEGINRCKELRTVLAHGNHSANIRYFVIIIVLVAVVELFPKLIFNRV